MTQEASELQFSKQWIKKAKVEIERANKVKFNKLLVDYYHKTEGPSATLLGLQ